MDPLALVSSVLQSPWLLPVLILMIAVDGPLPVLPSETVLMSGIATATVGWDVPMLAGLFLAAATGSMLGDHVAYGLGRGSHRMLPRQRDDRYGIARWVRANLFRRPVTSLAASRFMPGGRLVSTAAAGRMRLPARLFLAGSLVSSMLWGAYMIVIGLVLGPVTGGNPLLCILAGGVMAVLTTSTFALAQRLRTGCPGRSAVPVPETREPVPAAD
ncbi:DedA family protein [Pseudonocardia nantongensis]|uniref:DedA family protein n=1 Tax=Pseudonocardia nantongensis TaxID=1181885 RepID=UPI00397B440C